MNWCKSGTRQQTVHHPSDWHIVFPSCHQCTTLAPNIHTETFWMLCHSHSIKSTYSNTSLTILNMSVRILWRVSSLICLKLWQLLGSTVYSEGWTVPTAICRQSTCRVHYWQRSFLTAEFRSLKYRWVIASSAGNLNAGLHTNRRCKTIISH